MDILTAEQIEELKQFDAPTICNALDSFHLPSRTEGITKPGLFLRTDDDTPVIGYAATARISGRYPGGAGASDKLYGYYGSVHDTRGPVIACIQDIDREPIGSFWGEVQASIHKSLGAVATLTDGGVRDINEVSRIGLAMFSTQIHVSHAYVHVEDYNCPVDICGMHVNPGDLIYADKHGAVIIPHDIAPLISAACRKDGEAERWLVEPCKEAAACGVRPSIDEIKAWRQKVMDAKKKI